MAKGERLTILHLYLGDAELPRDAREHADQRADRHLLLRVVSEADARNADHERENNSAGDRERLLQFAVRVESTD